MEPADLCMIMHCSFMHLSCDIEKKFVNAQTVQRLLQPLYISVFHSIISFLPLTFTFLSLSSILAMALINWYRLLLLLFFCEVTWLDTAIYNCILNFCKAIQGVCTVCCGQSSALCEISARCLLLDWLETADLKTSYLRQFC